jgi:hypothetical protein
MQRYFPKFPDDQHPAELGHLGRDDEPEFRRVVADRLLERVKRIGLQPCAVRSLPDRFIRRPETAVVHHRLSSSASSLPVALVPRSATSLG